MSFDEFVVILREIKVLAKYHDYLYNIIILHMRDCDWFNLESNRGKEINEQTFRAMKSKVHKKLIGKKFL